ncbi:hypothetical protein M770_33510 (plasmid) [Pseudomonas aeruginosa VRFPA03]|nr:hypothetical protein M770_33510 [Pseudomonas aeruginosa VRFPA03]
MGLVTAFRQQQQSARSGQPPLLAGIAGDAAVERVAVVQVVAFQGNRGGVFE